MTRATRAIVRGVELRNFQLLQFSAVVESVDATTEDSGEGGVALGEGGADACAGSVCNGVCVNEMNDSKNCGGCGTVCAGGAVCQGGMCLCPGAEQLCAFGVHTSYSAGSSAPTSDAGTTVPADASIADAHADATIDAQSDATSNPAAAPDTDDAGPTTSADIW